MFANLSITRCRFSRPSASVSLRLKDRALLAFTRASDKPNGAIARTNIATTVYKLCIIRKRVTRVTVVHVLRCIHTFDVLFEPIARDCHGSRFAQVHNTSCRRGKADMRAAQSKRFVSHKQSARELILYHARIARANERAKSFDRVALVGGVVVVYTVRVVCNSVCSTERSCVPSKELT